ncbi:NADH dehydrogenase subunit N [Tibeticola sediminis]|uniref:NADH-quinone oxidoreductase subunit N n=1 Tax=Tibeticola sediminis TaxID=1917811 RepID=A0A3N4UQA3_9BURK|nr:NADH-quinone oxidoreductase subunit NuoN [Tibeticola sediminis]RPE72846.1 NADH dehydrogenase subunit N [Tibeticola sediminis]
MIDKLSWIAVYPEIILLVMGCVVLLTDLFVTSVLRTATYVLTQATLVVVGLIYALYAQTDQSLYGFGGMVVTDAMGSWLKCFAAFAVAATMVYARPYAAVRGMLRGGELFALSLFSLLGMSIMISGNHLLVIYLGLELLTLSSYALVALRRDDLPATEAAMKYFVLGAMASGFLLYGLSMIYGATGTLELGEVFKAIASRQIHHQVLVFGVVFVVAGLAFKLGVVPFHMWIPDVYQGAPTAITLLIAGAPKLAAFAIVMRLLVEGMLPLAPDWQQMLAILAVASLLIGNVAAIAQTSLKRMLAYSTIAQMGFMLLGLIGGVVQGTALPAANAYSSAMFYVVSYVLTTVATFGVILLLSREGFESDALTDLAGLNQRAPLYAGIMAACMFSLAGIPPLVGFYAKLAVLQALVATGETWHLALAVYAVLMSLIGTFYYLRVVKIMYFDAPETGHSGVVLAPAGARTVLAANAALLLAVGLLPAGLMDICARAIVLMLGS